MKKLRSLFKSLKKYEKKLISVDCGEPLSDVVVGVSVE